MSVFGDDMMVWELVFECTAQYTPMSIQKIKDRMLIGSEPTPAHMLVLFFFCSRATCVYIILGLHGNDGNEAIRTQQPSKTCQCDATLSI